MRNKRWNPALRHTILGEPGNEAYLARRASERKVHYVAPKAATAHEVMPGDSFRSINTQEKEA